MPPSPAENPKTFISYARKDSEFALKLASDLRKAGANIWLDTLDIAAGQRWDRAIQQALTTCPRIVVLLSPDSVLSENVMDEVHYALDKGKDIIPVVLKDCEIPYRLSRFQRVDLQQGISDLLRVLGVLKN